MAKITLKDLSHSYLKKPEKDSDFVITNSSLSMHLAGAFKIPSLTLLGECYESANLHKTQWGYPEGQVLGKEKKIGKNRIASIDEVFKKVILLSNT